MIDLADPYVAFPFLRTLEAAAPALRAEALALPLDRWIKMPSDEIYQGTWRSFLLEPGPWGHEYPGADFPANRVAAPVAARLLDSVPGVMILGYLRLEAGCEVAVHRDFRDDDQIRAHVGLVLPPAEQAWWPEGTARVMDVRMPHAARNPGPGPRVTLVVDVRLPFVVPDDALPVWGRPAVAMHATG